MLTQAEDDKYCFDCWHFPFLLSSNTKYFDKHISNMKEYVYWVLKNMKKFKNDNEEKLYEKYKDLLIRTILSFTRIKENKMQVLSKESKETVKFYSNVEIVNEFLKKYLHNSEG